jgi:polar amino acid transport system substrate-binding protein
MKISHILIIMLFCIPNITVAQDYDLASIEGLFEQRVGEKILPDVYDKLGLKITISAMPGNRAQREAVLGRKDGEIMRIWGYGLENPTMIRVPTPYYKLETMAFVHKNSQFVLESKADLANYNILRVRGVKHTNNITRGLTHVFDYDDTLSMMLALEGKHTSIALTNTTDGFYAIKKLHIDYIKALPPALATLNLYHYLNEKNAALVPKLDAVIKAMKKSGELDTLLRQAEADVFASLETTEAQTNKQ